MNTENKVFNKLFKSEKVELESQKYEFALADDIESTRNTALKGADNSKTILNKAEAALFQYRDSLGNVAVSFNQVLQLVGQLKAKSKELGIETPPKYLVLEKEANEKFKQYSAKFKAIDATVKSLI